MRKKATAKDRAVERTRRRLVKTYGRKRRKLKARAVRYSGVEGPAEVIPREFTPRRGTRLTKAALLAALEGANERKRWLEEQVPALQNKVHKLEMDLKQKGYEHTAYRDVVSGVTHILSGAAGVLGNS